MSKSSKTESEAEPKAKKKGGLMKLLLIGLGAILLVGGGVGAGLYAAGAGLAGGPGAPAEDPHKPKLVLKEGVEDEGSHPAPTAKHAAAEEPSPDPTRYQASYYPIEQSFTSNLRDSDGFVQLGIGVSTFYDSRVIENLKKNDMPVRSAVLMTLADQDAFVITTADGKKQLQDELKDAINEVLKQREGFGGVDSVYFTSFIIQ
jgi:flagellar protein FliL